jgi:hypothetical protein
MIQRMQGPPDPLVWAAVHYLRVERVYHDAEDVLRRRLHGATVRPDHYQEYLPARAGLAEATEALTRALQDSGYSHEYILALARTKV